MRGVLLLAVLALLLATLWSLRGGIRPAARPNPRGLRGNQLVKDPVCGTYVVSARAVARHVDGTTRYFCSQACADRDARAPVRPGAGREPEDRVGERRA